MKTVFEKYAMKALYAIVLGVSAWCAASVIDLQKADAVNCEEHKAIEREFREIRTSLTEIRTDVKELLKEKR